MMLTVLKNKTHKPQLLDKISSNTFFFMIHHVLLNIYENYIEYILDKTIFKINRFNICSECS